MSRTNSCTALVRYCVLVFGILCWEGRICLTVGTADMQPKESRDNRGNPFDHVVWAEERDKPADNSGEVAEAMTRNIFKRSLRVEELPEKIEPTLEETQKLISLITGPNGNSKLSKTYQQDFRRYLPLFLYNRYISNQQNHLVRDIHSEKATEVKGKISKPVVHNGEIDSIDSIEKQGERSKRPNTRYWSSDAGFGSRVDYGAVLAKHNLAEQHLSTLYGNLGPGK